MYYYEHFPKEVNSGHLEWREFLRLWRWRVNKLQDEEKEIEIQIKPIACRLIAYLSFLMMVFIAVIFTYGFGNGIPDSNIIKESFGANNICLLFDYPPATYVLPPFWTICVVLTSIYTFASSYR